MWISTAGLMAQEKVKTGEYPAPRYPVAKDITPEKLLKVARSVVRRPSQGSNFYAGYEIKPGERALMVVPSFFDRRVVDAVETAIREAGGEPDILIAHAPHFDGQGEEELKIFLNMYTADKMIERLSGLTFDRVVTMAEEGKYDILIYGFGGPHPRVPFRWEYILWPKADLFVSGMVDFPPELQEAIDQKAWNTLIQAKKIRVTDPEGTDISWTIRKGEFESVMKQYGSDIVNRGHLGAIPRLVKLEGAATASGVIAGTINHTGAYPHMKVHILNNNIQRIERGGSYGEGWQAMLAKYKDVHYPGHPGPGRGWLFECSVGTNPKAIRPSSAMEFGLGTVYERARSGIIHWGIGVAMGGIDVKAPELRDFIEKNKVPDGHFHVHNNFATMELETWDGKTITLIDKGRLTVLDDREIRAAAARHGNPDELLSEAYIPAVPGINVPGDYLNDYARNPVLWIKSKELAMAAGKQ
ncbi:MAG: hypothetical protein HY652_14235 [Acidobacteria bacterium]|nr:hypothetical protein [Acidobacteriota bacterium]